MLKRGKEPVLGAAHDHNQAACLGGLLKREPRSQSFLENAKTKPVLGLVPSSSGDGAHTDLELAESFASWGSTKYATGSYDTNRDMRTTRKEPFTLSHHKVQTCGQGTAAPMREG